jgi:hypothetical protein
VHVRRCARVDSVQQEGLFGLCNEILYDSTIDADALVSIRTSTAATNSRNARLDVKSLTTL